MSRTPQTPTTRTPSPRLVRPGDALLPDRGDLVGAVINRMWRVDARLGQGGLSDVYEVLYVPGACRQAMKVLRADASAEDTRRFEHEYRTLLHLDHPGLVRVHHYDVTATGQPFFTMELLRGRSLERVFDLGERVRPARVVRIATQVCSALAALHRRRIIHRDIKPGNIVLLDEPGDDGHDRVKVVDLGIARLTTGYYEAASNVLELTPRDQRLRTRPGFVLGTPGYIAPECASEKADERQDVYAVGVTVYRLLTGKRAFPTGDPLHVPITEYLPDAPPVLAELVERALAREPTERFASVDALRRELERALELLTSSFSREAELTSAAKPHRWWSLLIGFALGVSSASALFLALHQRGEGADVRARHDSPAETSTGRLEPAAVPLPAPSADFREPSEEPALPLDAPASEPEDPPAPSTTTPTRRRKSSSARAVFRRVMKAANASMTMCTVDVDSDAPISVRVRLERGRIADITRVGPPPPSVVDDCLLDTVRALEFPRSLSGTFTHRFTP